MIGAGAVWATRSPDRSLACRSDEASKLASLSLFDSSRDRQRQLFGAAAIDNVDLTGHEVAFLRGKPDCEIAHVLRFAQAPDRMHASSSLRTRALSAMRSI